MGDAHHFSPVHHDDHHVTYGHHDFHHAHFGGLELGFGWWSYPSYYDYPYYYLASYYEEPVNPSTASPYGTSAVPASYVTAQVGDTGTATETRVPGVVIPRMELPSREAPEALPEERPAGAPGKVPPGNPPPHKHSEEGGK